ncbi:beta family protein [Shewanella algae]|uniref:beta family protein n=1 Tax=Shewanella algae TaxID=38313 RepID=UPI002232280F|nr:beta family protein [Shewanella algae]UZD60578.1 beta family protein [Shewanella algae]
MNPRYVPILRTKQGEFDAYGNLSPSAKRDILPLFDLSAFAPSARRSKTYNSLPNPVEVYINDRAHHVSQVVGQASLMVDIFKWAPNSSIENGEHVLSFYSYRLESLGCNVIPVIGYERWEDREYSSVLKGMSERYRSFCIRLESFAFDDMIEEEPFVECIEDIIESMALNVKECGVILDFADVTKPSESVIELGVKISTALRLLDAYDFKFISIAGCSVSEIVNDMVPEQNSTGLVVRKEMLAWKTARSFNRKQRLVFGDYGVVNPELGDDIIAPDANGKIRYAIPEKIFVVRGYSRRTGAKGAQMYELSKELVRSHHYLGAGFSWGDSKVADCANELLMGNPMNWVSFDTNHHITFVLGEIFEFERSLEVGEVKALA